MSGWYIIGSALSQKKWGAAHNLVQGIKTDTITLQQLPNRETNTFSFFTTSFTPIPVEKIIANSVLPALPPLPT